MDTTLLRGITYSYGRIKNWDFHDLNSEASQELVKNKINDLLGGYTSQVEDTTILLVYRENYPEYSMEDIRTLFTNLGLENLRDHTKWYSRVRELKEMYPKLEVVHVGHLINLESSGKNKRILEGLDQSDLKDLLPRLNTPLLKDREFGTLARYCSHFAGVRLDERSPKKNLVLLVKLLGEQSFRNLNLGEHLVGAMLNPEFKESYSIYSRYSLEDTVEAYGYYQLSEMHTYARFLAQHNRWDTEGVYAKLRSRGIGVRWALDLLDYSEGCDIDKFCEIVETLHKVGASLLRVKSTIDDYMPMENWKLEVYRDMLEMVEIVHPLEGLEDLVEDFQEFNYNSGREFGAFALGVKYGFSGSKLVTHMDWMKRHGYDGNLLRFAINFGDELSKILDTDKEYSVEALCRSIGIEGEIPHDTYDTVFDTWKLLRDNCPPEFVNKLFIIYKSLTINQWEEFKTQLVAIEFKEDTIHSLDFVTSLGLTGEELFDTLITVLEE